jgi:hypothetical protein
MTEEETIVGIFNHLVKADRELQIAIGLLCLIAGGSKHYIGGMGDYKTLVSAHLKLQKSVANADRAIRRIKRDHERQHE